MHQNDQGTSHSSRPPFSSARDTRSADEVAVESIVFSSTASFAHDVATVQPRNYGPAARVARIRKRREELMYGSVEAHFAFAILFVLMGVMFYYFSLPLEAARSGGHSHEAFAPPAPQPLPRPPPRRLPLLPTFLRKNSFQNPFSIPAAPAKPIAIVPPVSKGAKDQEKQQQQKPQAQQALGQQRKVPLAQQAKITIGPHPTFGPSYANSDKQRLPKPIQTPMPEARSSKQQRKPSTSGQGNSYR